MPYGLATILSKEITSTEKCFTSLWVNPSFSRTFLTGNNCFYHASVANSLDNCRPLDKRGI